MNTIKKIKSITAALIMAIGLVGAIPNGLAMNSPKQAFVLFYMSSCSHCRKFEPVLKQYADEHHIPVLAYTLDGRKLPSFPNSVTPSREEVDKFFPYQKPSVPALFVMDSNKGAIYPVASGEASYDQLASRMSLLNSGTSEELYYAS